MFQSVKVENENMEKVIDIVKSKINTYEVLANPASIKFLFFDSKNHGEYRDICRFYNAKQMINLRIVKHKWFLLSGLECSQQR